MKVPSLRQRPIPLLSHSPSLYYYYYSIINIFLNVLNKRDYSHHLPCWLLWFLLTSIPFMNKQLVFLFSFFSITHCTMFLLVRYDTYVQTSVNTQLIYKSPVCYSYYKLFSNIHTISKMLLNRY